MWDELEIAPCDDPKAIRRAYAARLKTFDPDRDPAAFARLRNALEWALAEAESADARPADDIPERRRLPGDGRRECVETAASAPAPPGALPSHAGAAHEWLDETAADRALLVALDSALARRDAPEAVELYVRAAATGAAPLRDAPHMLERLFAVAVEDRTLDRVVFRDLARSFGWDKPPLQGDAETDQRTRVLARLAAEDWHDSLVAVADRRQPAARREVRIARLILRRIGRRRIPFIDRVAFAARFDEYRKHESWLRDRIDPAWMAQLDQRSRRRELRTLIMFSVFLAAMLAQFACLFVNEARDGTLSAWMVVAGPIIAAILLWMLKLLATEFVREAFPRAAKFADPARVTGPQGLRALFGQRWLKWPKNGS